MTSQQAVAKALITSAVVLSVLALFCLIPFTRSSGYRHYVDLLYPALVILTVPWLVIAIVFLWRNWKSSSKRTTISLVLYAVLITFGCAFTPIREQLEKPLGKRQDVCFPVRPSACDLPQGNFTMLFRVSDIPGPVRRLFVESHGSRSVMADLGQDFEVTDVITDARLPRMRLIFAGRSDDLVFVHFEHGGIGHSFIVEYFRINGEDVQPLWSKYVPRAATSLDDLRAILRNTPCSEVEYPCDKVR